MKNLLLICRAFVDGKAKQGKELNDTDHASGDWQDDLIYLKGVNGDYTVHWDPVNSLKDAVCALNGWANQGRKRSYKGAELYTEIGFSEFAILLSFVNTQGEFIEHGIYAGGLPKNEAIINALDKFLNISHSNICCGLGGSK